MKKIIGFFDMNDYEELPYLTKIKVIYEEDGRYFIQHQLSRQFSSLSKLICNLKTQEDIENEIQAYLSYSTSTINARLGDYVNNEDLPGNKYFFKEVHEQMLRIPGFYPIQNFNTYIQDDIVINEENPVYAFVLDGTDSFVGNRDYIIKQIEMLLEYPEDEEECNFKIEMLYDLEKFDELSDEVDQSLRSFDSSRYIDSWRKKKEDGQVLKFVYQKIKHKC